MKRKITKNVLSIITVLFLVNLSGCTLFIEQEKNSDGEPVIEVHGGIGVKHGRNPDIESEFERYSQNSSLRKDSVGYCDNIVYKECEEGYVIEGDGVLWGDISLCEIEMNKSETICLKGEVNVEKGNYKLIKVDQNKTAEILAEDEEIFDREFT